MARPTLLSERLEPAPDSATPTAAPLSDVVPRDPARRDLAEWLTRDLRVKGAPSERPPAERPSQPHTVVITEAGEPQLASWLRQDLKPRSSSLPPEALGTTLLASKWESVTPPESPGRADLSVRAESRALESLPSESLPSESLPSESLPSESLPLESLPLESLPLESLAPPADSLVPHAVSEAPAPLALRDAALDDEDLAVLPSRRGKKRDWRKVVVLAALLSVAGAVLWVASAPRVEELAGAAAAAAPAMLTAPLPPPPPSESGEPEPEVQPEAAPPAVSAAQGNGALDAEPELDVASGPRGRRAGDAVARFADLPSPTLSRLAREEQQRLRKAASGRAAQRPAAKPSAASQLPLAETEPAP